MQSVAEIASRISREIGVDITASRIRCYANWGLINPTRQKNRFRGFNEEDYQRALLVVSLTELGLSIVAINHYLNNQDRENITKLINNKIIGIENCVNQAKKALLKSS